MKCSLRAVSLRQLLALAAVATLLGGVAVAGPPMILDKGKGLGNAGSWMPAPDSSLWKQLQPVTKPQPPKKPAPGKLNLPSTWDYVHGFGMVGLKALDRAQGWRRHRGWTSDYSSVPAGYYTQSSGYYAAPANPVPQATSALPSNPPPELGPGAIRKIDAAFDDFRGAAVVNPQTTGVMLSYILDGKQYSLPPGYFQELPMGRKFAIQFDRGGNFGQGKYSIGDGIFTFTPTAKGWEVYQKPTAPAAAAPQVIQPAAPPQVIQPVEVRVIQPVIQPQPTRRSRLLRPRIRRRY